RWPSPLYRDDGLAERTRTLSDAARRARARHALLGACPDAVARDWPVLHALLKARSLAEAHGSGVARHGGRGPLSPTTMLRLPAVEQWRVLRRAVRHPGYAWRWLHRHAARVLRIDR